MGVLSFLPWLLMVISCAFVAHAIRHGAGDRSLMVALSAVSGSLAWLASYLIALPAADRIEWLLLYPIVITAVVAEWIGAAFQGAFI